MWLTRWIKSRSKSNEWGIPIRNFGIVEQGRLYRSAAPTADGLVVLQRRLGLRTVVDLRSWQEIAEAITGCNPDIVIENLKERGANPERVFRLLYANHILPTGVLYEPLSLSDREAPRYEDEARFLEICREPANWPILVHCKGGRHRTGGLVAAYRQHVEHVSRSASYEEAKRYGFYSALGHDSWKAYILEGKRR